MLHALSRPFPKLRLLALLALGTSLAACGGTGPLDWDLRGGGAGLGTAEAARQASENRPRPDARGVISYPGYQVAVAGRGDTVASVAARVGLPAASLAQHNALRPEDPLRAGEVLALPSRVGEASQPAPTATATGVQPLDVTTIATTALDRVEPGPAPAPTGKLPFAVASGPEPLQHRVTRGETAFSIARVYNVSARALADWNGLGPDLAVREGQVLLIPVSSLDAPPQRPSDAAQPGQGSPTPLPPSASKPLPEEETITAAEAAKAGPASPELGAYRTAASASRFALPVDGKIIRSYVKKKNDGIDIAAAPGTPVKAAADGTVAAITKDTNQVPILVIRHADGLLTVYAGIDQVSVAKGAAVKRGQQIAVIRQANPAFLHFEVRRGVDSVDPVGFLR